MSKIEDQTAEDVQAPEDAGQENLDNLLEEHGFDSLDDLKEAIEFSRSIKDELGDDDLDILRARSEALDKYEREQAEAERKALLEKEDPEDTIKRLEKELKDRDSKENQRAQLEKEQKAAREALVEFESNVSSIVEKEATDLSKAEVKFLKQFLGVGNQANEIDINSKQAVRKMAQTGIKAFNDLKQHIIKEYRAGKTDTPPMTPADGSTAPGEPKKPMSIKEGGKLFLEKLMASKS